VLQDPLVNEPATNNGRNGRTLRIVVFDNDPDSATYLASTAQYAYQLELQSDVADRINDLKPGNASGTDPRQGRNIGLSAIVAINDHEFLVLRRGLRPFKARGLLTGAVGGVSKPCGSLKMIVSLTRTREMAPVTASTLSVNRWSRVA
jgi:Esterase-like activity of phytase